MFTFIHMTNKTVVTVVNGVKSTTLVSFAEKLTVPTTMAELAAMDGGEMVDISVGSGDDAKTLTVPQVVRDYISGRKLRSNQEQQAENKQDDPAKLARQRTESWYGSQGSDKLMEIFQKMQAAKSPKAKKSYNDWLDKVYSENTAAIDAKA